MTRGQSGQVNNEFGASALGAVGHRIVGASGSDVAIENSSHTDRTLVSIALGKARGGVDTARIIPAIAARERPTLNVQLSTLNSDGSSIDRAIVVIEFIRLLTWLMDNGRDAHLR